MRRSLLVLALLLANFSVQAIVDLSYAEVMLADEQVKSKIRQAAKQGIYYLEVPENITH